MTIFSGVPLALTSYAQQHDAFKNRACAHRRIPGRGLLQICDVDNARARPGSLRVRRQSARSTPWGRRPRAGEYRNGCATLVGETSAALYR